MRKSEREGVLDFIANYKSSLRTLYPNLDMLVKHNLFQCFRHLPYKEAEAIVEDMLRIYNLRAPKVKEPVDYRDMQFMGVLTYEGVRSYDPLYSLTITVVFAHMYWSRSLPVLSGVVNRAFEMAVKVNLHLVSNVSYSVGAPLEVFRNVDNPLKAFLVLKTGVYAKMFIRLYLHPNDTQNVEDFLEVPDVSQMVEFSSKWYDRIRRRKRLIPKEGVLLAVPNSRIDFLGVRVDHRDSHWLLLRYMVSGRVYSYDVNMRQPLDFVRCSNVLDFEALKVACDVLDGVYYKEDDICYPLVNAVFKDKPTFRKVSQEYAKRDNLVMLRRFVVPLEENKRVTTEALAFAKNNNVYLERGQTIEFIRKN